MQKQRSAESVLPHWGADGFTLGEDANIVNSGMQEEFTFLGTGKWWNYIRNNNGWFNNDYSISLFI